MPSRASHSSARTRSDAGLVELVGGDDALHEVGLDRGPGPAAHHHGHRRPAGPPLDRALHPHQAGRAAEAGHEEAEGAGGLGEGLHGPGEAEGRGLLHHPSIQLSRCDSLPGWTRTPPRPRCWPRSAPARTSDPSSTRGCGPSCARAWSGAWRPWPTGSPTGETLWVSKHLLSSVHGCEGLFLAQEEEEFAWTPQTARGTVSHKAIELSVSWRGDPSAGELVDEAIARLIASNDRIGDYLGALGEGERAELHGEASERVNMFLECFPRLEPRWRPVAESRLRADLNDDRIVLSGKVDLTVGRAEGVRAGKVLIDLKTGGFAPSHRDDLRFYALIETLRLGVPPRLLASYYLDGGRLQQEVVSEDTLAVAVRAGGGRRRRRRGAPPRGSRRRPAPRRTRAAGAPGGRSARSAVATWRSGPRKTAAGSARSTDHYHRWPWRPSGTQAEARPPKVGPASGSRHRRWRWSRCPKDEEPSDLADPRRSDVDEWGRSEHMRELARARLRPDLPHWFRVEWEGLEKIPTEGGALLVANHAGAIPSDAPAIMHGIEKELGRPVYGLADECFKRLPVVGTCGRASAACSPTPTTPTASCASSSSSPSCSPRAPRAPARPTASATSSAASAAAASCEIAMRAGVPIIPIAVVGAEESMPILWKSAAARQGCSASRTCRSPPTCSPSGPLGARVLLPGQDQAPRARPGALRRRARPAALLAQPDHGRVRAHPAADPGGAVRHAPPARIGLVRLSRTMGRRVLITGLGTFWGGRVAQALEADPDVDVIVGLDRHEPTVPLERTEYVRSDENYSILARIVKATRVDTIVHTFLVVDSTQMRVAHDPRDQRHRHHEPVRRGVGAGLHRAQRRREVVHARLRRPPEGPGVVLRGDPPRAAARGRSVERSLARGRGLRPRLRRGQPARATSPCCGSPTCSAPTSPRRSPRPSSCPLVPSMFGFDPRFQFVHEDDVVRAILFVLDGEVPGIYNVAGDGLLPWSEVAAICGKRTFPLPPFGLGPAVRAAHAASASTCRRSCSTCSATAAASTTAGSSRSASTTSYTSAGTVADFVEALRLRRMVGEQRDRLPVRTRRRAVLPPLPRRRSATPRRLSSTASCRWRTSARARWAGCRSRSCWRCRPATGSRGCCGSR